MKRQMIIARFKTSIEPCHTNAIHSHVKCSYTPLLHRILAVLNSPSSMFIVPLLLFFFRFYLNTTLNSIAKTSDLYRQDLDIRAAIRSFSWFEWSIPWNQNGKLFRTRNAKGRWILTEAQQNGMCRLILQFQISGTCVSCALCTRHQFNFNVKRKNVFSVLWSFLTPNTFDLCIMTNLSAEK